MLEENGSEDVSETRKRWQSEAQNARIAS
jgi:hypothetical protein